MANIKTADALIPSVADKPLDARCRVNSESDIPNIDLPFVGLIVYVIDTGKYYKITALKDKTIGGVAVQNAAVDTYEEIRIGQASTITLPIPSDDDLDNISLVVDFSLTGEFNNNEDGTPADYSRVTMIDHYAKMRVFVNENWETLAETSVGAPYYYGSVSFTLDDTLLPGYVAGTKYYARYTWFDSSGAYDGWIGFSFVGDVADLRPIRLPEKDTLSVTDLGSKSGELVLDYADGDVQNIRLVGDATLDIENVSGVIFGKALVVNVTLVVSSTLTVIGDRETMEYSDYNRTYTVIISNFGKLAISVSETL